MAPTDFGSQPRRQRAVAEKPSAEAGVELPPGELERLRINQQEMTQAAEATQGHFYTLATADNLLNDLPAGYPVSLSTPRPPLLLWNPLARLPLGARIDGGEVGVEEEEAFAMK
jgi:hypothetical protein